MASRSPYKVRVQRRSAHGDNFTKIRISDRRSTILSCEFHKNGTNFLASDDHGRIYISNSHHGFENQAHLIGHNLAVTEVHYSRDGTEIYSCSLDKTVGIWDASRCVQKSILIGHKRPVCSVQYTQTGDQLVCSGSSDHTVRIWDIRQKFSPMVFECEGTVTSTFSRCGNYIFTGGFVKGGILIWDIRQTAFVRCLSGHSEAVTGLSLSPCGRYLASCSADNTLRTWDVSSEVNGELQRFSLLQTDVLHLRRCAWSPCGRMLTAGTTGRRGILFDVCTGRAKRRLFGHKESIIDIAFHPTKPMLVSTGADKSVIVHQF